MTETKFLLALSKTVKAYKWKLKNNTIVGIARNGKTKGILYDPVTAICRYSGKGGYKNNSSGRKTAASKIGIDQCLLRNLEGATTAKFNRGYSQTLRGKIRQALEV